MPDDGYLLDGEFVARLRRLLEWYEGPNARRTETLRGEPPPARIDTYLGWATGAISAATSIGNQRTITAASWSSSIVTITTSAAHNYQVGEWVSITGMTPTGYNGSYVIVSVPSTTTFTYALTSNPGTATGFGKSQTTVLGSGTAQIYNLIEDSAGNADLADAGYTETVYNLGGVIAEDQTLRLEREPISGKLIATPTGPGPTTNPTLLAITTSAITAANLAANQIAITAASWSTGAATYTTSGSHGFQLNEIVSVTGMSPSGWNGFFTITAVTSNTFTVGIAVNPGTATVFGTAQTLLLGKGTALICTGLASGGLPVDYNLADAGNGGVECYNLLPQSIPANTIVGLMLEPTTGFYFASDVKYSISVTPSVVSWTAAGTYTWTKPANLLYAIVECNGSGASSATAVADATTGVLVAGAGGCGAYARSTIAAASLPATASVVVGAGGAVPGTAPTAGNPGVVSSFNGGTVVANGGQGGSTGTIGDLQILPPSGTTYIGLGTAASGAPGGTTFPKGTGDFVSVPQPSAASSVTTAIQGIARAGTAATGGDASINPLSGENAIGQPVGMGGAGTATVGAGTFTGNNGNDGSVVVTQFVVTYSID